MNKTDYDEIEDIVSKISSSFNTNEIKEAYFSYKKSMLYSLKNLLKLTKIYQS
jgi:hypothetical protein